MLIKMLKASKKQFYDEDGQPCSVEQYVDYLIKDSTVEELQNYQKELGKTNVKGETLSDDGERKTGV